MCATANVNMGDDALHPGFLGGIFFFKKLQNGNLDKTKTICTLCKAELAYCRSSSSMKYHVKAKHPLAVVSEAEQRDPAAGVNTPQATGSTPQAPGKTVRQARMTDEYMRGRPVSAALSAKLTSLLAQWIAIDCRPISVVEDDGLQLLLQAATGDPNYKLPARRTIVRRIHDKHATEKAERDKKLTEAACVALTGDHWTSVGNDNYLGVTVHLIDFNWELHSFALGTFTLLMLIQAA